jgi:hypothetical protein
MLRSDTSMSITPEEAAYEEYMDDLHREWEQEYADEYRKEGAQNFINQRLASYFVKHPGIEALAEKRCSDARALLDINYDACTVLAYSATEVGFKNLLLKPIIYGFVNSDHLADLVSTAAISTNREQKGLHAFVNVLFTNMIMVDIESVSLTGQRTSLWKHIEACRVKRNSVMHRVESVQRADGEHAVDLASFIVENLFPLLRDTMLDLSQ